jgi:hypothetical protein
MLCAVRTLMLTLKITILSSCVVATILGGVLCHIRAPLFFFSFITCPVMSFSLFHLVLTNDCLPFLSHLTNLFTKPRTVLLSICLFLPHVLPITLAFLPISSSLYPRMYYT